VAVRGRIDRVKRLPKRMAAITGALKSNFGAT
jgi:hypothetical protein